MPEDIHQRISNRLIGGGNFEWNLSNHISYTDADDGYYFIHDFFPSWNRVSTEFINIQPLVTRTKHEKIVRCRANLYTRTSNIEKHGWHTDQSIKEVKNPRMIKGLIYYINSNDGKTILQNSNGGQDIEVESVANRALIFDSYKLHRSTSCTNQSYRSIISMNFIE